MKSASWIGLACLLAALGACQGGSDTARSAATDAQRASQQTTLPEEVVPLYGEAAAYKGAAGTGKTKIEVDVSSLVKDSKVDTAIVAPYDADNWYEPVTVKLARNVLTTEIDANRDFVVALDLGEVARNNYLVLTQMTAVKGLLRSDIRPRICNLILCPADRFRADTLLERLPDLRRTPVDFRTVLPRVEIGSVGRPSTICEKCLEVPGNALPCLVWRCGDFPIKRKIFVRRNIYSLTPAQITSLRAGVAAMKKRPASDPTSWLYQAKMHAVDSGVPAALQDQCQHRQFFFFSWHRMFIYYFERILRKASGDPNLTLPYWNYTDVAGQGVLPEPFRQPANTATNSLYNSTRQAVYNNGVALPAADVSYAAAFNLTNFTTAANATPSFGGKTVAAPAHFPASSGSGRLEQSPHNNVHNDIGGEMATGESPRDPIFWLHHANIDRLWKKWLALGNGRTNPTGDAVWMNQTFTFFDENGAQKSFTGAQILNTVTQLNYRYDDDPLIFWPTLWKLDDIKRVTEQKVVSTEVVADSTQTVRLADTRRDVPVPLTAAARDSLSKSRQAGFGNERVILQLRNIQYDQPVGVSYLLFLNLPADAKDPDNSHPNFIGTLGFFGKTEGPGHKGAESTGLAEDYDITELIQRLGSADDLRISVIPSYPRAPADRKDLQDLVAKLKPKGNPRFGRMTIVKQRIE
jgi:Common central domain of tyrosinase/Polyphenol oxidase middle domain/Protein of unknown function (DUF_B2219)